MHVLYVLQIQHASHSHSYLPIEFVAVALIARVFAIVLGSFWEEDHRGAEFGCLGPRDEMVPEFRVYPWPRHDTYHPTVG
jgi:hypothetical protein